MASPLLSNSASPRSSPTQSRKLPRKLSFDRKTPRKSIEDIPVLTQEILLKAKRLFQDIDRSFLDRIVADDITNSFRFMFSPDLEAKPYFTINSEECVPPVQEGDDEACAYHFHDWFLHQLDPLFKNDDKLDIPQQLDVMLTELSYSNEDRILSNGFKNYGMTKEALFRTIQENEKQCDEMFLKELKNFDVTDFEKFAENESPGSLGTKLVNAIRERILNEKYKKVPAISVLKRMTIGAYSKADLILRDDMLKPFYLGNSPYRVRPSQTSYNVEVDPHYKGVKCVVSQKKTYNICKVEEVGLIAIGSFNVQWSFEDYNTLCNARLELSNIQFVNEKNSEDCLAVLRLFKAGLG